MKKIMFFVCSIVVFLFFGCNERRPNYDSFPHDEMYAGFNDTAVTPKQDTLATSAHPEDSYSHSSSQRDDEEFNDGYEHGQWDAEDDANHERYDRHRSRSKSYDKGYEYGYQDAEEDDEWDDEPTRDFDDIFDD